MNEGQLKAHHKLILALVIVPVITALGYYGYLHSEAATTASCTVSAKLVNSCRPWLGAFAYNYPQTAADAKSQLLYHEQRIGRQADVVHSYHPAGNNQLSSVEQIRIYK